MAERYTIAVDDSQLSDLKSRLALARFPDEVSVAPGILLLCDQKGEHSIPSIGR